MKKFIFMALMLGISAHVAAEPSATYIGKIKSLYSHERDSTPYFGIELEGEMDNNPCGSALRFFIKSPNLVSELHLSMLLAAHLANKTVEISNANATDLQRCHGQYPTFNFVKIL
ncbi:hypothetical protein AAOGI_41420 [Agarivorans albus]